MRPIYINLLTIIILFSLISTPVFSQNNQYSISGKIVDASNNSPVEFANIGIKGTFLGTASDIDGMFKLTLNDKYSDYDAVISAVGYQTKKLKVGKLSGDAMQTINLTPVRYGISQVDIKAQSMVLYGIIKSAENLIRQNYITEPFEYNTFFLSENKKNNNKTEAVISVADSEGYRDRTYTAAFVDRSYKIDEIRRNFEVKPIDEGVCDVEFMLLFDIARVRGNILDSAGLFGFELKLEDITVFTGDSIWAISYKNSKPDFSNTGNRNVTQYSGVIYISKTTNAVVRNELDIETDGHFQYGYTAYYNDEIISKSVIKASYKVVTLYRKDSEGKYMLSSVGVDKVFSGSDGKELNVHESMKVLEVEKGKSTIKSQREYYSDKPVDKKFWERFTIP